MNNCLKLWGLSKSQIEKALIENNFDIYNCLVLEKCLNARITILDNDKNSNYKMLKNILESNFFENIYSYTDITIAKTLVNLLNENNFTVATAESLTGGMLASSLVDVTGVSNCFFEGIVTYSNESKMQNLNVKKETLNSVGAVSSEVALQMVKGLMEKTKVDMTLSTTGIAGPTGDSETKPLGLTYIGIKSKNYELVKKYVFNGDRDIVRGSATNVALGMGINFLKNIYKK